MLFLWNLNFTGNTISFIWLNFHGCNLYWLDWAKHILPQIIIVYSKDGIKCIDPLMRIFTTHKPLAYFNSSSLFSSDTCSWLWPRNSCATYKILVLGLPFSLPLPSPHLSNSLSVASSLQEIFFFPKGLPIH